MACFSRMTAYLVTGAGRPVFDRPDGPYRQISLPCGGCIGCRIQRGTEWTLRLVHEAQLHEHNQFLTLTYNDDCLPGDYGLDHEHFQKFIRSLRKRLKVPLRFFMCGEYGSKFSRPHYHAVIFGLALTDLEPWKKSKGHMTYRSAFLEEVWDRGHVYVGESVTQDSCGYVADYLLKEGCRDNRKDVYWENPETGEQVRRKAPYIQMSRRPGIGHDWLKRFFTDVFPNDKCIKKVCTTSGKERNREFGAPKYYRRLLQDWNPAMFQEVMARRELAIDDPAYELDNTPERLAARELVAEARLKRKETSL